MFGLHILLVVEMFHFAVVTLVPKNIFFFEFEFARELTS